jgi:hypothetical protein
LDAWKTTQRRGGGGDVPTGARRAGECAREGASPTLAGAYSLAIAFYCQTKYEAVEAMAKRALERTEKALGREHLETLDSAYGLSLMLMARAVELRGQGVAYQGEFEEAKAMARRALDGKEKALGKEH